MNVALRPGVNIISLCTGGGGLDLGIKLAMPGARSVCLVEREAFAVSQLVCAIQQGLMAEAAIWSDVTTFDGRPWRGIVDGIIGGIPCQPHSLAGKRLGEDDERDLWSDARRIIVQSGAWFVLIENVAGMLSAQPGLDPGALRVRRDLQRLGFDVEGGLFTASEVGASHERERVFILAVAHDAERRWGNIIASGEREGPAIAHRGSRSGMAERRKEMADGSSAGRRPEQSVSRSEQGGEPGSTRRLQLGRLGSKVRGDVADPSNGQLPVPRRRSQGRNGIGPDGAELAYAGRTGRQGDELGGSPTERDRPAASGSVTEFRGTHLATVMVDAEGIGRREGESEPGIRGGRHTASGASGTMADTDSKWQSQPLGDVGEFRRRTGDRRGDGHLFPPGPSDLSSWRNILERAPQLEPAFRRVADGLASRLDVARVDRLRMLGNGVVPLQAAYAIRTLAARLAEGGSAGAARLVRMMEAAA